ncbi:MAG: prolipoprotein diacylglyceryl transferase, partial [bacterium]|nr:prolipoprotein diacylglyceryl transferase [bacterium]
MIIRWYGVMYVVAFWAAWFMLPSLGKMRGMFLTRDQWTSIVAFGALGVLVGGRVGYAFFYEPLYFLQSPLELFSIWNGGMSSHGGFIGAALGVWWATRFSLPPNWG